MESEVVNETSEQGKASLPQHIPMIAFMFSLCEKCFLSKRIWQVEPLCNPIVFSSFHIVMTKFLTKATQGRLSLFGLTFQDAVIKVGKVWSQGCEAPDHLAATVGRPRTENSGCLARFLLCMQPSTPAHGMELPTFKESLLSSVNLIWKLSHRHALQFGNQD